MTLSALFVSYLGEVVRLDPDASLAFGRGGDLFIDDNPFLHRLAGRLSADTGSWTLENTGSKMVLTLRGEGQVVATSVPPGQRVRLIDDRWSILFSAGPTTYEIEGWFDEPTAAEPVAASTPTGATQRYGAVELTADQRLVAVALCQQFLHGQLDPSVPANKEIATQLGWTNKAVQRKIDNLVDKLTSVGVRGLKSSDGIPVSDRRGRLVQHLVLERIVIVADLALLE